MGDEKVMVVIKDFFTEEQMLEYSSLANFAHQELEEKFSGLLKLDVFPELIIDTNFDSTQTNQRLTDLMLNPTLMEDGKRIKAVETNEIMLFLVPSYAYMITLGFDRLDQIKLQIVFREYMCSLMLYEILKAHDIKYTYDRFLGESVLKEPKEILSDMVEKEKNLHYFKALDNFYKTHWKTNKIGCIFTSLNFSFISYLEKNRTVKGMITDPIIFLKVQQIKDELNLILNTPTDKIVLH